MQQESLTPATPGMDSPPSPTAAAVAEDKKWLAQTYHPLPVVISSARGAWVEDIEGKRYLDCLAGYSALNFGHGNERLIVAARRQLDQLTMTSRAFYNDKLTEFARELDQLAGADLVIPMNTGAEAVESAIKAARAWGYRVKGVEADQANIIVMGSNFHGRTTTIISFSDDPDARDDFGPYTPGFRRATFGDANSVAAVMDDNTVAVLVEPIQGEAGVVIPPDGFLRRVRDLCTANNVLMIADEIQSGLGRTGTTFACELWGVKPDLMTLGKALGGGIVPVSAVVGRGDVLGVLEPGQHGSTFGGNPLASAVGLEVVRMLTEGTYQEAAKTLGSRSKNAWRIWWRRIRGSRRTPTWGCGVAYQLRRVWVPAGSSAKHYYGEVCWRRTPMAPRSVSHHLSSSRTRISMSFSPPSRERLTIWRRLTQIGAAVPRVMTGEPIEKRPRGPSSTRRGP